MQNKNKNQAKTVHPVRNSCGALNPATKLRGISNGVKNSLLLRIGYFSIFLSLAFCLYSYAVLASSITPEKVVELVNGERSALGIEKLTLNSQLSEAARLKARDMIAQDYFAHVSPEGVTPWFWMEKAGYDYKYAGENLAMDFISAESQHNAWMESKTHRQNILNPNYREIGIAVESGVLGGRQTIIAVQMFGGKVIANKEAGISESEQGSVSGLEENFSKEEIKIIAPQDGASLNVSSTKMIIQAPAGAKVGIYDRGIEIGEITADDLGLVSYKLEKLGEGIHQFQVKSSIGGKSLESNRVKIEVDLTAPKIEKEGIIVLPWAADPVDKNVLIYHGDELGALFVNDEGGLVEFEKLGNGTLSAVVGKNNRYQLAARDGVGNLSRFALYIRKGESGNRLAVGDIYDSKLVAATTVKSKLSGGGEYRGLNFIVLSFIFLIVVSNIILISERNRMDNLSAVR